MWERKSSVAPLTSPEMDTGVWSRLPEELLDHILSLLPLKIFLSLRSTCKHFKSLIFSPSFISKHSSSSTSCSFLLLSHPQFHHQFPLYDTTLNTWRNLSLSLSTMLSCSPSSALLSTSNGLLCFSLPTTSSFLICNLLSKSSRIVKFPSYPFSFELLNIITTPEGYKLFMLSSTSESPHNALVYDSGIHQWRELEGKTPIFADNYHQEGVYYDGCLYFTTPEPFSVVYCDLETGKWERSAVGLPNELKFARLVSNAGEGRRLFLFGGIGRNGISKSMKLWELSREGNWVEIELVPEMMCRKFVSVCYHNYEHMYCFWHQGMVCVCCYTWPEILYYKLSRGSWHWLPKCPSLPDKWSCGFRWFSIVPELYAFV